MYGIRFAGHPDLRRIYLYDEFEGHPLRKDYPKEKRQPLIGPGNTGKWSEENERRKVIDLPLPDDGKGMLGAELMRIQMGPSHPATHGTLRIVARLDTDGGGVGLATEGVEGDGGFFVRGVVAVAEEISHARNPHRSFRA